MSREIQVGDLVIMVKGHSCLLEIVAGIPFTVTAIEACCGGGWTCNMCFRRDQGPNAPAAQGFRNTNIPLPWLKRIPPSSELENVQQNEEIPA